MKTAAYTICFNEINRIDRWIEYTKDFDYRVVLDTGSTDGTYELLKKLPNIILHQQRIEPFKFNIHRNINLSMVPEDVEWCLSPDIDEWFSLNVLEEIEKTVKENPDVTNISFSRLDIFAKDVIVGPPNNIPLNKIHKKFLYEWRAPIYEHLWYIGPNKSVEIFNKNIFLIHDQDTSKPRELFYVKLMESRFLEDPSDCWNNWFLLYYYYNSKQLFKYIDVAVNFIKFNPNRDNKYYEVYEDLKSIIEFEDKLSLDVKQQIAKQIQLI